MGVIVGPIAPFSNPPIEPQWFKPWRFVITAIALGQTTTVTMTIPSITFLNYVVGQEVRLIIPPTNGSRQLNQVTGIVIGITPPNQVTLNINSLNCDPFVTSTARNQPQIVAIGDNNFGQVVSTGRNVGVPQVPGTFINISPFPGD
jgi:hypothetical protein